MDNVQHDVAETQPLLRDNVTNEPPRTKYHREIPWRSAWQNHISTWGALYACAILILLVDIPSFMAEVPRLRMFELGLCRDHYLKFDPSAIGPDGSVDERLCKIPAIQRELAKMRGWMDMLEGIPGLILAIPYGILADHKGKRLVMGLSLVAFVLRDFWIFCVLYFWESFPTKAAYAGQAFLISGGGSVVISPLLLAIIAASVPEALRTRAFFWVQVVLLSTELVAPPMGAWLMNAVGPHFAFLCSVPLEATAFLMLGFMPNSATKRVGQGEEEEEEEEEEDPDQIEEDDGEMTLRRQAVKVWTRMSQDIRYGVRILGSQRGLLVGLLALIVAKMARPILGLILQYMSVRFDWPLAKTAFLLSIQAAGQILLFVLILPQINVYLLAKLKSPTAANLVLVRSSVAILTVGTLCMAFAPSAPTFVTAFFVYTLGNGFTTSLWSLMTTMVSKDHLSLLCTAMAVFEGISIIGASPLLGLSFSAGLDIGGVAVALPFFIAAAFFTMAAVIVFTGLRAEKRASEEE